MAVETGELHTWEWNTALRVSQDAVEATVLRV